MNPSGGAPAVVSLRDPRALDPVVTGGKAANLGRLLEADLPVPEGVCVTTAVYDRLRDDEDLTARIDELDQVDSDDTDERQQLAGRIRAHLRNAPLPERVRPALAEHLEPGERYVVRSSATAEDLPTASFAGQHETVLDVQHLDEVLEAVSACLASLFTDRAVAYRARNGIPHRAVAMAVVVQRMVDADASGVLFTADPLTGRRDRAAIDAAPGLGEALVSGSITPDHALIDRATNHLIEYRTGTDDQDAPADTDNRVLSADQLRTLVSYGDRIEALFDAPQDVEWSLVDGTCWILQSRPITTLFPLPAPGPTDEGLHVYFSFNHRQGMTEPMPPLVTDFWVRTIEYNLTKFGFDPPTGPAVGAAGGLLYIDATHIVRSKWVRGKFFEGLEAADPPAVPLLEDIRQRRGEELADVSLLQGLRPVQTLTTVGKFLPVAVHSIGTVLRGMVTRSYERAARANREWCDRTAAQAINRIRAGADERKRLELCLEENERFIWEIWKQAFQLWNVYIYRQTLEWLCPDADEELAALERGLRNNVTTQMMLELGDIADRAREHPPVETAIRDGRGLEDIRALEGGEEVVDAFEDFLAAFGFRAPAEIEFSKPRYTEDPTPLHATVRANLTTGSPNEHRRRIQQLESAADEAITDLEKLADRGRLGALRNRLVRPCALRYRGFLAMREGPKYGYAQFLAETRRHVLAVGERLASDGVLEQSADVWLCDLSEVFAMLEDPTRPSGIDFEARRAAYAHDQEREGPRVITSDGEVPRPPTDQSGSAQVLSGTSTARGIAEGTARVVHDPRETVLEPGEILVTRDTDPGWTPLFLNAAGLVTSVGGRMTHGSIVAREHGIPSVVVPDATTHITSGQRIRVDGDRGIVEIQT